MTGPEMEPFPSHLDALVGITGAVHSVYAARSDGAIFVLVLRGTILKQGVVEEPYWSQCPSVPGTIAWHEEQGEIRRKR